MYTQLKNCKLWYDGDISIPPEDLASFLMTNGGSTRHICVESMTKEIQQHNKFASQDECITVKTECAPLNYDWKLPKEYQSLNIRQVLMEQLGRELDSNNYSDSETEIRMQRVVNELDIYEKNNLFDVLKTIFFIINTFTDHNVVWGVGRGSSVSSYVLYLLRVHDVDSVKYNLHIKDFIS